MTEFHDACVGTDLSAPCDIAINLTQIKVVTSAIAQLDFANYNEKCKFRVPTVVTSDNEAIHFKHNIKDLGNVILNCKNLKTIILEQGINVHINTKFICPDTLETFESYENEIDSFDLVQFNKGLKNLVIGDSDIESVQFIDGLTELQKIDFSDNAELTKIDNPLPIKLILFVIQNCPIKNIDEVVLPNSLLKLELSLFEINNKFPLMPNTLVYLNIDRTNTSSLDCLPIMPNLTKFIFNEDKTSKSCGNWIANKIDTLDLAKFPALNELIASYAGIKKIINYESNVFKKLDISRNKLTEFKNWKFERITNSIDISHNLIVSIADNQFPRMIDNFEISYNKIDHLPMSVIYINVSEYLFISNCPIENLNDPIIRRWVDRCNKKIATVYNNSQNVHDADIVESIKQSIVNLAKLPKVITASIYSDILNNKTIHSEYHLTECEIALLVENCIATKEPDVQKELHIILKEAIIEGRSYCLTGRIGRIINVLSGFDDNVVIKIANSEQIANVILAHQKRNAPHEELIAALKELQMSDEEIGNWMGTSEP